MNDYVEQFRNSMQTAGLNPPSHIITNGEVQRFSSNGKRGDLAGWYILRDGIPIGFFGDWRTGLHETWRPKIGRNLSLKEIREQQAKIKKIQQEYKKEQAKQEKAARQAMHNQWNRATFCKEHDYLTDKALSITEEDDLRLDDDGNILCPIRLITGELISTQTIPAKGKKKFHWKLSPKNGFHTFGSLEASETIYFAEGIATALSVRDCIDKAVICVYGKNFNSIAPIISKSYPDKQLIYCCDQQLSSAEKITSEQNAKQAIALVGGIICLPNFVDIPSELRQEVQRSDYNDLLVLLVAQGFEKAAALGVVRQQITNTINSSEKIMSEGTTKKKDQVESDKPPKMSEILLQLIDQSEYEFFHDEHQDAFCKYPSQKSNVYETRKLADPKFKSYLSFIYRRSEGKTISDFALKEALAEMEGRALHDSGSKQQKVFLRVGQLDEKIYIDLCNERWQAIEISKSGWNILDSKEVPVRFERPQHALPLPDPSSVEAGDISKLWDIVNIPKDDQVLVLAYILECFRSDTAFPILVILGLQDSGKSATQNTIRSLIDPSSSNLRTPPRKGDDLVTEAHCNWLVRIAPELTSHYC